MKSLYTFRIDDVTPWMNWDNFYKLEQIFDTYWIKPIIWVVPNNMDEKLDSYLKIDDFWWKIKKLANNWWIIAQHWYEHKYSTKNSWIIWLNKYSEFAWLTYEEQLKKIAKWKIILEENLQIKIKWWMSPAHSFDKTTCIVLKELWFEYITDWIAIYPFEKYWLKWLPQQLWRPIKLPFWIWTVCLHPNTMKKDDFKKIELFFKINKIQNVINEKLEFKTNLIKKFLNLIFRIIFNLLLITKRCLFKKG